MKVITRLKTIPFPLHKKKICLAIGNFDGGHIGHKKLLNMICRKARRSGAIPAVLTFIHHPRLVLRPNHPLHLLTPWQERLAFLKRAGIHTCYLLHFTKRFSRLSPDKFVHEILVKRIGVYAVYMGFNARFGHKRSGTVQTMKQLSRKYGFHFQSVKPVKVGGKIINSTYIRSLVEKGQLSKASRILAHPPLLIGTVIHGSNRGARLGFPTANIRQENGVLPPRGVYIVSVDTVRHTHRKESYGFDFATRLLNGNVPGLLNFGYRPTFQKATTQNRLEIEQAPIPEVFLLKASKNLYGARLNIFLLKYLRKEIKFPSPSRLVVQIKKDVRDACKYMKNSTVHSKSVQL